MSQKDIVSPVATVDTNQCTIIPPWFVQNTEYPPTLASYAPLVNGEETFRAVHEAIANAQKTVDIICWGFQPSMYFIRNGKEPCIGELLIKIAKEKKIEVRVLGWESPFNTAGGLGGESNQPGKGSIRYGDKIGQTATDEQYFYDRQWYTEHSYADDLETLSSKIDPVGSVLDVMARKERLKMIKPLYVGRGFNLTDRAEIAYQAGWNSADSGLSLTAAFFMTVAPTHHQKTVIVDYELPESAVGFVMGHNMLDEYWDTDKHSALIRGDNAPAPNLGPRGKLPRQDMSSRVTGPILEQLHENFAKAWLKETGQDLLKLRNAKYIGTQLKPRADQGTPLMAQLLRTQKQEGKTDIEKLYLKTVNNATQSIYIENQYFRWPPLAEAIKSNITIQKKAGRIPEDDGYLYLFVVSNVTKEGIGPGTGNTQRMLESLGRGDTIPELTRLRRIDEYEEKMNETSLYPDLSEKGIAEDLRKRAELKKEIEVMKNTVASDFMKPIDGLKVHICSLVAKDSPADAWMPVYIHSKLMIINDVFTTHGSANINTRSMETDSEMNIAHDWAKVTKNLRRRLWNMHTSGRGVQDDPAAAFKAWELLLADNNDLQKNRQKPSAPLIKFLYDKNILTDQD
ncbi:phospholipase D-like domain-containing protein [Rahnella woolbedingensis]|uniref:Phospholipase n=1 Tax=Rahnella woolbedingensis TaxID=1510574 RepID=A0A419NAN4_9GAMM|nr:phospholipase D-like domain-containing protein [Rahnella woolbedingensis]RJT45070.1 phospholipase [Rahnella woolbedingensis]